MSKKNAVLVISVLVFAVAFTFAAIRQGQATPSDTPAAPGRVREEASAPAALVPPERGPSVLSEDASAGEESPVSGNVVLVPYTGPVYHVFYHFLIAFPDIAYSNSYGKLMDAVCVTPLEFTRSLEELYKNGYVLIDINKLITIEKIDSGKNKGKEILSRAELMLPEGKKPLVVSFDDINYYSGNLGKGTADKVVLDEQGNFAMQTLRKDGTVLVTYDNDVIPLLERFIADHPDFSPDGTRGTLALTGFDGILGYRIQKDSPHREKEIEAVKPIVAELKARGWNFASHSYGHIHTRKAGVKRVKEDADKWADQIAGVVGDTRVYVYPFGEYDTRNSKKFDVLYKKGFRIFCGVGMKPHLKTTKTHLFMDRANIDGYSLRNHAALLKDFMDSDIVYDAEGRHEETGDEAAAAGSL